MILVTGATGFVGAEILRRASRRGWRIRGLARSPHRAKELGSLPHVELFRGDVTDPGDLDEAMEDVTAVIHLVGIIIETRRQTFERAHVGGTVGVLEAAGRAGVRRVVHMSALGAVEGRDLSEYFRTKWKAEEAVRSCGMDTTIFRPSLVFGREDEFFNRLAVSVRWSPVVPLPGRGETQFQPVWVGDVAECFLQAARMEQTAEPEYDVAGPEVLSFEGIVQALMSAMGKRRAVAPIPLTLVRAAATVAEALLPRPPVTRDQLAMLGFDNVSTEGAVAALLRDFEIEHPRLADKSSEWLGVV